MILLVLLGMLVGVSDAIMCYDDIELDNVQVGFFNWPYNITILFTSIFGVFNFTYGLQICICSSTTIVHLHPNDGNSGYFTDLTRQIV